MIAAEAQTPLERVRRKLEETFGEFAQAEGDEAEDEVPETASEEEELIRTFSTGDSRAAVEIEYRRRRRRDQRPRDRAPRPGARAALVVRALVGSHPETAQRSFRLDRMRGAKLLKETFDPRPGLEPRKLRDVRVARVLFDPEVAPGGGSSAAPSRSPVATRLKRSASAAPTGSSARSSPTAASPEVLAAGGPPQRGRRARRRSSRPRWPRSRAAPSYSSAGATTSRRPAGSPPGSPPGLRARTGS